MFSVDNNETSAFNKLATNNWNSNTQVNWIIQNPTGGAMTVAAGWYIVTITMGANYNRQPDGPDATYATEPSWFGMIIGVANPQYNYALYNDITSWGMALNGTFIVQLTEPGSLIVSMGFNTKNAFAMIGNNPGQNYYPNFSVIKLK